MTDAQAVVQGVAKALKPGGRFVAEMGGSGNIAAIQTALQQALSAHGLQARPCWYFPDAGTYAALLMENGFAVQKIMLFCPAHTSALRCGGLVGHFCRADAAGRIGAGFADASVE